MNPSRQTAVRIPGREVVVDDVLVLEQGDRVAADALVLEARELEADESLLTGESIPVRKRPYEEGEPHQAQPGGDGESTHPRVIT